MKKQNKIKIFLTIAVLFALSIFGFKNHSDSNRITHIANQDLVVSSIYPLQIANALVAPLGIELFGGVARNNGSGWELITTGGHYPLNIDSITNSNALIHVHLQGIAATEVVTMLVGPDETFAGVYHFGSTVGTSIAGIEIKKPKTAQDAHLITHNGNGNFTFPSALAGSDYNTSLGRLRIRHAATDNNFPQVQDLPGTISKQTLYVHRDASLAGNRVDYYLYNLDGTQKSLTNPDVNRLYFNRAGLDFKENVQNPNNVVSSIGNIWIIGIMKTS